MEKHVYKNKVKFWEKKHPLTTAIMVGFALIIFWRGVWMLADIYLFPNNPILSALLSIAMGILILYIRDFDLNELYR